MNTISISTKGGLGNTLFQISTALAVSFRDNLNLIVDSTEHYGAHNGIERFKKNIFRKINFSKEKINFSVYGEKSFEYEEIPKFHENTKLNGYFQSEKYFLNYRDKIIDIFSPTIEIENKINSFLDQNNCSKDCVSLHVRRGDYVGIESYHPTLPTSYYKRAYELIGSDRPFLIFSDDISWCVENLDFIKNKIFVRDMEDVESLYLMSYCKDHIIANSTFSWWGSWMNKNKDKKVIIPQTWFGPSLHFHNTKDIYIKDWIVL